MHEVSLIKAVLERVQEEALELGASKVLSITLEVGDLSGVSIPALEFAFDSIQNKGVAQDADLIIERKPLVCLCDNCKITFRPEGPFLMCEKCLKAARPMEGLELMIKSIEYEEDVY